MTSSGRAVPSLLVYLSNGGLLRNVGNGAGYGWRLEMGSMFFFQHSNLQIEFGNYGGNRARFRLFGDYVGYSWGSRERFPSASGIYMGVWLGHRYLLQVLRQRKMVVSTIENRARMAGNAGNPNLNIPSLSLPSHF